MNSNRLHKSKSRSRTHRGEEDRVIQLLEKMVSYEDQSRLRMEPDIPDVPRMRLTKGRVYTAAFSYTAPLITGNSTTETQGAISFQLSNANDASSWLAVFDSYRMLQVQVEFIPYGIGVTGTTQTNGTITTVLDYDDSTLLPQTGLLQYDTVQVVNSPQFFERRLVPRAATALYNGAIFSGYGQATRQWIASNSPNTPHYGIKYSQAITSSAVTTYSVLVTMFVQFRDSH